MNVFEDLVVELKEENLLEQTVMDLPAKRGYEDPLDRTVSSPEDPDPPEAKAEGEASNVEGPDNVAETPDEPDLVDEQRSSGAAETAPPTADPDDPAAVIETGVDEAEGLVDPETESEAVTEFSEALPLVDSDTVQSADIQFQGSDETVEIRQTTSEREFFKKRAAAEMSSLKMVEAVLSAVEREQLKNVPKAYDDLDAKKALHAFQRVAEDASTDEHKEAEFRLLNETQLWCSALAERDANISVSNLRRYCETCRPMLSSQAMLAIARFYRNLPYCEIVRGKFDFVITRLFSRPVDDETRNLLFTRDEMVGHIKTLYGDWASVPLYSADNDDSQLLLTALSFEEMSAEAELVPTFDDLIKSDFFGRLRLFKESIAELFFAPVVTASAIEANVRVGNVYVKLIDRERKKMDAASIHQRFGDLDDQTVSEAVARTLELVEILRERAKVPIEDREYVEDEDALVGPADVKAEDRVQPIGKAEPFEAKVPLVERLKEQARSVNRLFLVIGFVLIAISAGIYLWGSYFAEPTVPTAGVKTLSFQGTDLGENVKIAKLSGDTLFIVGQPAVDTMSKDKITELLQKLYAAGKEKGWLNVSLMNSEGKAIGFVSPTRMDVTPVNKPDGTPAG